MPWFQGASWGGLQAQGWMRALIALVQTVWSTTDKGANVAISNNDRTASVQNAQGVRGVKGYGVTDTAQFQFIVLALGQDLYIGVARSTASVTAVNNNNANSYFWGSNGVRNENGNLSNISPSGNFVVGDVITIRINNGTLSYTKNGALINTMAFTGTVLPFVGCGLGTPQVASGTFAPPDANNTWG